MSLLVALTPTPRQLFLNPSNGAPASGFKVFQYAAGTTTKLATYTDSTGNTPNANPIILDSLGECDIWIPPYTAYKLAFANPTDTDPPTNPIWTRDGIAVASTVAPTPTPISTRTVLLSGTSSVYTTPPNCRQLSIRMVGGGGGGGGASSDNGASAGSSGTATVFNGIGANGGGGGDAGGTATAANGGAGGLAGAGGATFRSPGQGGSIGPSAVTNGNRGGTGGSSALGGGAAARNTAQPAGANSGGGGSGASAGGANGAGGGGGGGEYVELVIGPVLASYVYTVGAGGAGGASDVVAGGAGGSGVIIITEIY